MNQPNMDCIFCKIINGELESSIIYQDDICTAFLDIRPVNPGHVLIIPNHHMASIYDLDEKVASHMFIMANRINKAIRGSSLHCEGINYFLADGEAAFQEVFHTHLHCFPRFKGDGFRINFDGNSRKMPSRQTLNEVADEIKKHL